MPLPGLNEPYPFRDAIVDKDGFASREFDIWLQQRVLPSIDAAPTQIQVIASDDENDDIGTTDLIPSAEGGLYRVNPFVQVMIPDGASSAVQVSVSWQFNGQTFTKAFTNVNGNLATSISEDPPFVFRATSGTPITFMVTYSSGTPNAMVYSLTISIELMRALA